MATEEDIEVEDIEDLDEDPEDLDEEFDDDLVDDEFVADDEDEFEETSEEAEEGEEGDEALDELEAEELELLDDEEAESILVDEQAEIRAIRREELTMDVEAKAQRSDEFVCQSCFLVKRTSQLANRRKMICHDCAT